MTFWGLLPPFFFLSLPGSCRFTVVRSFKKKTLTLKHSMKSSRRKKHRHVRPSGTLTALLWMCLLEVWFDYPQVESDFFSRDVPICRLPCETHIALKPRYVCSNSSCSGCKVPADSKTSCVDSFHNHVDSPHTTPKSTFGPALLPHTHTHTHPDKNVLCFLPLVLLAALFLSEREEFKWCDRLISSHRCTCERGGGVRSGLADSSRGPPRCPDLQRRPLPSAITRPVSALHGSLICSRRRSSGGAVHAGNSEFAATLDYFWRGVWVSVFFGSVCAFLCEWIHVHSGRLWLFVWVTVITTTALKPSRHTLPHVQTWHLGC